jgi:hypothetical protein
LKWKHPTSNIQQPTSSIQNSQSQVHWLLGVGCWLFDVEQWKYAPTRAHFIFVRGDFGCFRRRDELFLRRLRQGAVDWSHLDVQVGRGL